MKKLLFFSFVVAAVLFASQSFAQYSYPSTAPTAAPVSSPSSGVAPSTEKIQTGGWQCVVPATLGSTSGGPTGPFYINQADCDKRCLVLGGKCSKQAANPNDFSARFMDFVTNINTQFSALGDSILQRNSAGARFGNFVTITTKLGFFPPDIASNAKSFGNVSATVVSQINSFLGVQNSTPGVFDRNTSVALGLFIKDLTLAERSLPMGTNGLAILWQGSDNQPIAVSEFNTNTGSFNTPLTDCLGEDYGWLDLFWCGLTNRTTPGGADIDGVSGERKAAIVVPSPQVNIVSSSAPQTASPRTFSHTFRVTNSLNYDLFIDQSCKVSGPDVPGQGIEYTVVSNGPLTTDCILTSSTSSSSDTATDLLVLEGMTRFFTLTVIATGSSALSAQVNLDSLNWGKASNGTNTNYRKF